MNATERAEYVKSLNELIEEHELHLAWGLIDEGRIAYHRAIIRAAQVLISDVTENQPA